MKTTQLRKHSGKIPIYHWALASYPILQLLAHNIFQVEPLDAVRPLLLSLAGATLIFFLLTALFGNKNVAALVLGIVIILFFSYGHLYQYLKENPVAGFNIGRHRYLVTAYVVALISGIWIAVRNAFKVSSATPWLNILAIGLLVAPVIQISDHFLGLRTASRVTSVAADSLAESVKSPAKELRDIYYIVLDTYMRGDALKQDMRYDNSEFLQALEELGFYIADCSRSNYGETILSLTSSLNMDYIPKLHARLADRGLGPDNLFVLLRLNSVRSELETWGYKTVAFQTAFEWADWRDADFYLFAGRTSLDLRRFSPLEVLFIETTAAKVLLDGQYILAITGPDEVNFRFGAHVEHQRNILDRLPTISSITDPTFTFAHILIPHSPYVFGPDGQLRTDPGFYSGDHSGPVNEDYLRSGYTGQVAFVNDRILEIVEVIISDSKPQPIIVIQGDHGLRNENRIQILNAYYFPGEAKKRLYSDISPVNTFRILLDEYFGTDLGLLPDRSYGPGDNINEIADASPICNQDVKSGSIQDRPETP